MPPRSCLACTWRICTLKRKRQDFLINSPIKPIFSIHITSRIAITRSMGQALVCNSSGGLHKTHTGARTRSREITEARCARLSTKGLKARARLISLARLFWHIVARPGYTYTYRIPSRLSSPPRYNDAEALSLSLSMSALTPSPLADSLVSFFFPHSTRKLTRISVAWLLLAARAARDRAKLGQGCGCAQDLRPFDESLIDTYRGKR